MIKRSTTIENNYLKPWVRNGPDGSDTAMSAYLNMANSCMFDSGNSDYMSRTPSVAGNRKTWTFSTWVKRGKLGAPYTVFGAALNYQVYILFLTADTLEIQIGDGTTAIIGSRTTTQVFRDIGAWYHIVLVVDTTNTTAADRIKLYINGSQIISFSTSVDPSLNADTAVNDTVVHEVGRHPSADYFDGYLAETIFVDGQALTPSSFGEFDSNGIWQPKEYTGTYGTNGFRLTYSNSGALGTDYSGNGNSFTTSGLTTSSQYDDTPSSNHCVFNPIDKFTNPATIAKGNLEASSASYCIAIGSIGVSSGKWYWEVTMTTISGTDTRTGIYKIDGARNVFPSNRPEGYSYMSNGNKINNASQVSYGATYTSGDVIGVALDMDSGEITFYKNGVSQGSAYTGLSGTFAATIENGEAISKTFTVNFGQQSFAYTPPTGFKALSTSNFSIPVITKPGDYFDVDTYTGTGAILSRAAIDFQPDLVWIKSRSAATEHELIDSARGVTNALSTDSSNAESSDAGGLTAFNSNGFTIGADANYNNSGQTYVAWCWEKGSVPGFDIVLYTGNGSNRLIAHSLGVVPKFLIVKSRSAVNQWHSWHVGLTSADYYTLLNSTVAEAAASVVWNSTAPTSTNFSIGTDGGVNTSGTTYVAYLFAEIEGFSKFGKYTGNGSTDGPFIYCGFRPAYVMVKRIDDVSNWDIYDSKRLGYNIDNNRLFPNLTNAEDTTDILDILSNGFKLRSTTMNTSSGTYIYMAFAESPFKYARAR